MSFGPILSVFFLAVLGMSLFSSSTMLVNLLLVNAVLQSVLFLFVACIPFWRSGRMSYVDIAWPFGVALIGAQILLFADGDLLKRVLVGCIYLFIGLRMGLGGLLMAKRTGIIFKREFPRYQYRKLMFEQAGTRHTKWHMLAEVCSQGFANMSVLALPGFLIALNPSARFSSWEIIGLLLWCVAYGLESLADAQKLKFIMRNKGGVCNVGLWKYSRHPNYFSEWLVWTALVIASVPSWLALQASETPFIWLTLGVGSGFASVMLYITLVYLTDAKPAEFYSVQKRVDYKEYQQKTPMFFPWFPKD